MKRKQGIVTVSTGLYLLVFLAGFLWLVHQNHPKLVLELPSQISKRGILENQSVQEASISGKVFTLSRPANSITLGFEDKKQVLILLTPKTKILNQNDIGENFTTLQKGFTLTAFGQKNADDSFTASQIKIISSPAIIVYSPKENQIVGKSFEVQGVARVFENNFFIRLKNTRTGTQYVKTTTTTNAALPSRYGDFTLKIDINNEELKDSDPLLLELFQASSKDGSEVDKVSIPLVYHQS